MLFACKHLLRKIQLSPLIRLTGLREHTFKWGVGTAHSLRNNLKLLPPTAPHPKEKQIPTQYFKPPADNIKWCRINEQWEVFWYELEKLNAKPFPVRKFGVERAKSEAIDFSASLRASGRMFQKPNNIADSPNVFWDDRLQCWFATFTDAQGMSRSAGFSAGKWGYDTSRQKAVERSQSGIEGNYLKKLSQK